MSSKPHNPATCKDPDCQLPGCRDSGGMSQEEMVRITYDHIVGKQGEPGLISRMENVEGTIGAGKWVAGILGAAVLATVWENVRHFLGF